ncbi:TIGR03089 family protein [Corynebacterium sp. 32222D000AT]|uniref:TIGR03089 family protein n=1 Tax=unclassified Corynebacterium TaxID=2624378 RepID=UPI002A95C3E2|nr:TIGR03089 family protein [Mycobacteriaceae bacterium]MDY5828926.1 TIGR03089 family protein [Corynebacterium sp.]
MDFVKALLDQDPAAPRITVYTEATGARLDFSAQTLQNWVAKIANMLAEELDLEPGDTIAVNLPVSWQAAVICLGALARDVRVQLSTHASTGTTDASAGADTTGPSTPQVVFTSPERFEDFPGRDVVLVTEDPFGRGVVESGGALPLGAIDFGPTVRFYGDQYFEPTTPLPELVPTNAAANNPDSHGGHGGPRVLSTGWHDWDSFRANVLEPLALGGSAVVVSGLADAARLEEIRANEKATELH